LEVAFEAIDPYEIDASFAELVFDFEVLFHQHFQLVCLCRFVDDEGSVVVLDHFFGL
jgi:hypothetical protein